MADNVTRCEPPPELQGVDGWHWLVTEDGDFLMARWCDIHRATGWGWRAEGAIAFSVHGATNQHWRYIAPVTPAAEVKTLRVERDALAASCAAAGYVVERDWQPIETAPRDVWVFCWSSAQRWLRIGAKFNSAGPRWYYSGGDGPAMYSGENPTHWRPLPAGPNEEPK